MPDSRILALNHYNITVTNKEDLNVFIGPPLSDSFQKYFGFDKEKSIEAISVYREYFSKKGIFENTLYEGVPEMLDAITASGVSPGNMPDNSIVRAATAGFFK